MPFYGSCWGLQVAVVAAGGVVRANPRGREFGFGRRIVLNVAGRAHSMFAGKPAAFEAITVHRDEIAVLPPNSIELASNEMGLQAAEVRHARGVFWGVQYHPEYTFAEIAATAVRYGEVLIREGLLRDQPEMDTWVTEVRALQANRDDARLCWRHGIGPALRSRALQLTEIRNWLESQVR
jgi:GMP synthase (glutamine-hydrolysing)